MGADGNDERRRFPFQTIFRLPQAQVLGSDLGKFNRSSVDEQLQQHRNRKTILKRACHGRSAT